MPVVSGLVRGCGQRTEGSIYLCCDLSPSGQPLEAFLFDPPIPVDSVMMGIPAVGVQLRQDKDGIYHVLDWIGEDSYNNVCDWLEEARIWGSSRKVSDGLDFSKLTPESRHIFLHPRGYILNREEYYHTIPFDEEFGRGTHNQFVPGGYRHYTESWCPIDQKPHTVHYPDAMCAGLWWEDLDEGTELIDDVARHARRTMPSIVYYGNQRPADIVPQYQLAMICQLPISRIQIVRDPYFRRHERAEAAVEPAVENGILMEFVDE